MLVACISDIYSIQIYQALTLGCTQSAHVPTYEICKSHKKKKKNTSKQNQKSILHIVSSAIHFWRNSCQLLPHSARGQWKFWRLALGWVMRFFRLRYFDRWIEVWTWSLKILHHQLIHYNSASWFPTLAKYSFLAWLTVVSYLGYMQIWKKTYSYNF